MPLQLTGTWEHALLTAAANEVAAQGGGGHLGGAACQKLIYFFQAAGVPMRYRFDIYHYGPHCDRITRDLEWLLADEVLTDASLSSSERGRNYLPGSGARELLQSHAASLRAHQETISKVVQTLLPLDPDHLELLATLDYLYRQKKAGGGSGPWKEAVIDRFMEVKKDKFQRTAVSAAYDSMIRAGLIEA
jgi:uncharacterized protein YwgA